MKARSLLLMLAIVTASASYAAAQVGADLKPGSRQGAARLAAEQEDNDLVSEVFSPITDQLNLTAGQKFRIANIATSAALQADPLFQQLNELDNQLSQAAFTGRLDESQIKDLADKQAALLSEVISMKARARMSFFRVLTNEQRAVVAEQFRARSAAESLGSISNQD